MIFSGAKWLSITLSLALLAAGMMVSLAKGSPQEAAETRLAFEVASVKPSKSVDPSRIGLFSSGGRYDATAIPLRYVIWAAYEIEPFRMTGGPGWLDTQGFDISAKAEAGSLAPGPLDRPRLHRLHLMLRTLLEERFQLAVHHATKPGPLYELVVTKGGFKLQALKNVDCEVLNPTVANPGCGDFTRSSRNGFLTGPKVEIRDVAEILSRFIDHPVADRTGIQGYFNVNLHWTIRTDAALDVMEGPERRPDPNGLTVFAALEQQLGLKLEAKTGPIEILVLDRVERPPGN